MWGFKLIGLEEVKIDRKANRVTAVGTMNPWKLRDKIEKETKHKVDVLCSAKDQKAVTQVQICILFQSLI